MENLPAGKAAGTKSRAPLAWIAATVLCCALFAAASAAPLRAQDRGESRRYLSQLQNVFDFVQRYYVDEVDPRVLYEGAMSGMLNALGDPYTVFLQESELTDLSENVLQGNYGGVGLYISKPVAETNGRPPYVEVASPIEDTPGWRAGLKPGDLIIEINGEATDALTMDEVLARLKGPAGVQVNLLIRRGKSLEFPITLTREIIEVPTVKHEMIGDTAYLKLISFSAMTVERTREALEDFQAKNYRSLVLDLRNNYGGLISAAVGVCDLFLDEGVVVTVRSRFPGETQILRSRRQTLVPQDVPVIVLINRGSASASEIVAGALKDRGRAFLVGEKSFGKGSVQQVYPLDRTGFKITTARYYTPSDVNIDKIGIPPDREVLFPEFTAADTENLSRLILDQAIPRWVEEHPGATRTEFDRFSAGLAGEYLLDLSLLRRLVRDEQNRTSIAPVYDLEYDVQLQEAVKIIREGSFSALMQTARTLRELQEEESDGAAAG